MRTRIAIPRLRLTLVECLFVVAYVVNLAMLHSATVYWLLYPEFTYIAIVVLATITICIGKYAVETKDIVFIVLILISAFVNTRLTSLAFGEYFGLIWFFGLYLCMKRNYFTKAFQFVMLVINLAFLFYLGAYELVYYRDFENASLLGVGDDTGLINTNQIGMGVVMLYWLARYHATNYFRHKAKSFLTTVLAFIVVILSRSRASLAVLVVGLILYHVFGAKISKSKKLGLLVLIGVIAASVAFPIIYVALWRTSDSSMEILGKPLFTGREWIWNNLYMFIKDKPRSIMIGTGKAQELFWHGKYNLHNSSLALFSMFGLIPTLLYYLFVMSKTVDAYRVSEGALTEQQRSLYVIIVSVLLFGIGETILTYTLSMVFLSIALAWIDRKDNQNRVVV